MSGSTVARTTERCSKRNRPRAANCFTGATEGMWVRSASSLMGVHCWPLAASSWAMRRTAVWRTVSLRCRGLSGCAAVEAVEFRVSSFEIWLSDSEAPIEVADSESAASTCDL